MHMIYVTEGPEARYAASLDGEMLCTSKTPFFAAARELLKRGFDPDAKIGMTRDGQRIDMTGTIGKVAKLSVSEGSRHGPVFREYNDYAHG